MSDIEGLHHEGVTIEHIERGLALAAEHGLLGESQADDIQGFARNDPVAAWGFLSFIFEKHGRQISFEDVATDRGNDDASTHFLLVHPDLHVGHDVRHAVIAILTETPSVVDFEVLRSVVSHLLQPTLTPELIDHMLAFGVQHTFISAELADGMSQRAQHSMDDLMQTYDALRRDVHVEIDMSHRVESCHATVIADYMVAHQASAAEGVSLKGRVSLSAAFMLDRFAQILELATHVRHMTRADLHETRVLHTLLTDTGSR